MSFLKAPVIFPSNFTSIFSTIKHNSSILFHPKLYIFWSKAAHESANFWDSWELRSKLVKFPWQFWTFKAVSLHFLHHYSLSWHTTPLQILSLCIFNFRPNDAIRIPFLRLSSAPVKICQIPHVIFGSASQFSFKLCINLECHQT